MGEIALAKYFGFDLIDYKRQGDSVLIASGAGIMMSIMDVVPRFKYCIDIDSYRQINNRVPQLISALDLNCSLGIIGIAGWFSIDKPKALQEGISKIKKTKCVSYSGNYAVFPNEVSTLELFITNANRM
jgi:hypothetical protein